jgi:hypothetical protein
MDFFSKSLRKEPKCNSKSKAPTPQPYATIETSYSSTPVAIPPDFLKISSLSDDVPPIQVHEIDFSNSSLPEYCGCYAAVIENVLSASECSQLLRLAEQSTGSPVNLNDSKGKDAAWQPALINAGGGREVMIKEIRDCGRIIWDDETIVGRLWDRCLLAPGLKDKIEIIEGAKILGESAVKKGNKWRFARANERMRFLKYGKGQYFRRKSISSTKEYFGVNHATIAAHQDGAYRTPDGKEVSFYTLHLYLNDSVDAGGDLKGGATTFHSNDMSRRLDVDAKTGQVLIFQHRHLLHSGDDVLEGTKFTLRTDLMYEREV